MDLMEFKQDQAAALAMAYGSLARGSVANVGMLSSVGVRNLPLFTHIITVFTIISGKPPVVAGLVALTNVFAVFICYWIGRRFFNECVGLIAAAFFAASPWAIVYSRTIWAQDLISVLAGALLYYLLRLVADRESRSVFWALVWAGAVAQIHLSGACLFIAAGIGFAIFRPKVRVWLVVAGLALAALPAVPYLLSEVHRDFPNTRRAAAVLTQGKGVQPRPDASRLDGAKFVGDNVSDGGFELLLGSLENRFNPQVRVGRVANVGARVLFVLAFCYALWQLRARERRPLYGPLLLWVSVPVVLLAAPGLPLYPHYFVIIYPAQFLLMACLVGDGLQALYRRFGRAASIPVWAIVGAVMAAQASFTLQFHAIVAEHGGTPGGYGVAYVHKLDAIRYIMRDAGESECEVTYGFHPDKLRLDRRSGEAPLDYQYLWLYAATAAEAEREPTRPKPARRARRYIIVNTFHEEVPGDEQLSAGAAEPARFGPLLVYRIEAGSREE